MCVCVGCWVGVMLVPCYRSCVSIVMTSYNVCARKRALGCVCVIACACDAAAGALGPIVRFYCHDVL